MRGRLVILGNGGAALSAARAARASGHGGEICLVSDTGGPAFNPMLAPYYLKGHIPWERCFPYLPSFYRDHDIKCLFGEPACSLDAVNREVALAGGGRLSYDTCLIATGASPALPPVAGLAGPGRACTLRTPGSVIGLEKRMARGKKAVVLGASLVGLKAAEILAKRGLGVVLLDVVDQVLPGGAHPGAAALLAAYFAENGVDVRLGCTMEGMEDTQTAGGRQTAAGGVVCRFSDGSVKEADLVVACTGVRPNIGFVDPGQVDIDQAVLVDSHMRTSSPGLYAAGDASQAASLLSGKKEWLGTWRNACLQGRTAGINMAGGDVSYGGSLPENISPFFDWTYAQIGDIRAPGARHAAFGEPEDRVYGVIAFDGDVPVGANLINCTRLAGPLRTAIAQRSPWGGPMGPMSAAPAGAPYGPAGWDTAARIAFSCLSLPSAR